MVTSIMPASIDLLPFSVPPLLVRGKEKVWTEGSPRFCIVTIAHNLARGRLACFDGKTIKSQVKLKAKTENRKLSF